MSEKPIKIKKCHKCKQLTAYNPSMPYQTPEERNPTKCAYCGTPFKQT